MKFRTLLVILLIAGLLTVYYFFGTDYLEERRENSATVPQIAAAKTQLAQIPAPPTDTAERQGAASANFTKEKNAFPSFLNSTMLVNTILKVAEMSGVKAIPVITQPWVIESAGGINYPVFRLNIAARGSYAQIADFINRLEREEPETLVIGDLKVVWATGQIPDDNEAEADELPEASIDIAIYSRPVFAEPGTKAGDK
jgi:hypothetical protein